MSSFITLHLVTENQFQWVVLVGYGGRLWGWVVSGEGDDTNNSPTDYLVNPNVKDLICRCFAANINTAFICLTMK